MEQRIDNLERQIELVEEVISLLEAIYETFANPKAIEDSLEHYDNKLEALKMELEQAQQEYSDYSRDQDMALTSGETIR